MKQQDLISELNADNLSPVLQNTKLAEAMSELLNFDVCKESEFNYYTANQINALFNKHKKHMNLSLFHVNIHSLNANHSKLV